MQVAKPKYFQITLKNCGFDSFNNSYGKMTDTNAERLLFKTVLNIANDFVAKEDTTRLVYYLALDILNEVLKDKPNFNLVEELKTLKEKIESFTIIGDNNKKITT